ncbi:hypothetical protein ACFFRR_003002 [Megaselia abdita]
MSVKLIGALVFYAVVLVYAKDNDVLFSGNRTEIIRHCYSLNNNYVQMIANRMAVEDDKCSSDFDQSQQSSVNEMVKQIAELVNKVDQVKKNLQFTGSIYQVLEQLTEVDKGNVEDLKTVAYQANVLQTNMTMEMSIINGLNENCKATVLYNSSIALNEIERGLMMCSLSGEFPEIQHGWINSDTD